MGEVKLKNIYTKKVETLKDTLINGVVVSSGEAKAKAFKKSKHWIGENEQFPVSREEAKGLSNAVYEQAKAKQTELELLAQLQEKIGIEGIQKLINTPKRTRKPKQSPEPKVNQKAESNE